MSGVCYTAVLICISVFLSVATSQEQVEVPLRCAGGCISPGVCRRGYYFSSQWRTRHFRYCCRQNGVEYRKKYDSETESVNELDCRFRQIQNFASTDVGTDIVILDLSFNKLENRTDQLHEEFLKHFTSLRVIKLASSNINRLSSQFLSSNAKLEHVDLGWNKLTEVPEDLFSSNPEIVKINLAGNRMESLPVGLFRNTRKLEEVHLENNLFQYITSDHFAKTPLLRYLDASENDRLICISADAFDASNGLEFVKLDNTGFRLHRKLQNTFCTNKFCQFNINDLRNELDTEKWVRQHTWRIDEDICKFDS